ncbi:unnamed protein product [Rotaria sp. Silwood1]|nr:unnamed protein product [Rotaria sp. Silwood1]
MENPAVTTDELRVRTVIELITNETYYENMYSQFVGALCNVLRCNIRSIYPKIDFREGMEIMNNIFTPAPPTIANCDITILWSHTWYETDVRAVNNNLWSPNHFVPLMSSFIYDMSDMSDHSNTSTSIVVTPKKKTFKNNTPAQIRSPEFESPSNRRFRGENNMGIVTVQLNNSDAMRESQNGMPEKRQIRLDKRKEQSRSSRANETEEQRQIRLEKQKMRDQSSLATETDEERQIRLKKLKERSESSRTNETIEQRQIRLKELKERSQSSRTNETVEQRQTRLDKQRKRSQANRAKKKLEKRASNKSGVQQQDIEMQFSETDEHALCDSSSLSNFIQNEHAIRKKRDLSSSAWPEPISHDLKKTCLQQFLQQMSMSALAEVTCAVCNVRSLVQTSKKVPISKIPNIHLLKVSDELKDLILSTQSSVLRHSIDDTIQMTGHVQNSTSFNSASFYYENGIILYTNGLHQENKTHMSTLCQKCHVALTKGIIPKFSAANNMWLGDVPAELQDLTIPEEKLISLYRHNSCVIKLHSPFHSTTTAQTALKGNCITFLQNVPDIVNSLPLQLEDLYDTLKVIFIGAHSPERIQLKKVLTVRKKKIIKALQWLKKYNVLYQHIDINLKNIDALPEDNVPECIMSTMEQKLSDEEVSSERVGYIPDPLSNPTEYTTSDTIPINNSGVLDVNGSTVSSNEIANYILRKMKNNEITDQKDHENIYLIPHSSKPVNEYFNPKLLVGLYPTLFCYGRGSPEDQTRPVKIQLREHIRYLLSYNDRRFEKSHSFIFVVFNLLQRRDACFHAQLIATKPYFRATADEIQSLKSKDIEIALDNISKKAYHSESNNTLNKLLHHIKTIGGRVMGSAYSRMALRTHIHALIYNQGLPSIFLTLNPADIHSPVALYFAGVPLDLDNIQIDQLMDTYKRAEIIASHPVATAKFFHLLITNILDTMIVGGVLGPVKAYFGTVESQGRGSLHLHLLIWLVHDMKPADMKEKIQNADFREKLKAYLEDIIKEDLDEFKDIQVFENLNVPRLFDTPPRLSQDNIYAALRTIDLTGLAENINKSPVWSTPIKQQLSPSIPYASPSIPDASPLWNKSVQTPTHDRPTSSKK